MAKTPSKDAGSPDLADLIPSWNLDMEARRLSKNTIKIYRFAVDAYVAWCRDTERTVHLDKRQVQQYIVACLEEDRLDASSVGTYLKGIKAFAKWCLAEGEITSNEVASIQKPALDDRLQPSITDEQHAAILATCDLKTFEGKRDDAIIRLMGDAGGRAKEISQLEPDDIHIVEGYALIHGKGRKDRLVAFGPDTALSLDRYKRARRRHAHVGSAAFWLGAKSPTFGYTALFKMVKRRAVLAGIPTEIVQPHAWRRRWADGWLDRGGSEGGLKALGGWSSLSSVEPYVKRNANQRALREDKRLREDRDSG